MDTQRGSSPDIAASVRHRVYVDGQEVPIPQAYAEQYQLSLFRIAKDEHIVISNVQYKVVNKIMEALPTTLVKVNVVLFANPAEPFPPALDTSEPAEMKQRDKPLMMEAGPESFEGLAWYSEQQGSYLRVGDIYKLIGNGQLISRVRHVGFTDVRFVAAMVIQHL